MAKFEENCDLRVFFGTLLSNFRQYRVNDVKRLMQLFFVELYRVSNNDDLDTYFFSCSTHPKKSLYMKLFSIFQSKFTTGRFSWRAYTGFQTTQRHHHNVEAIQSCLIWWSSINPLRWVIVERNEKSPKRRFFNVISAYVRENWGL